MAWGYQRSAAQSAEDDRIKHLIINRLSRQAEGLARQYLGVVVPPGCSVVQAASISGGVGTSFALWVSGPKQGEFFDFNYQGGDGRGFAGGNMLDFVIYHEFAGNFGRAIAHYRSLFGLDDKDPARVAKTIRVYEEQLKADDDAAAAAIKAKAARAQHLWLSAVPIAGTPAEAYLQMRVPQWRRLGAWPGALRYRPDVNFCPVRGSGPDRTGYPAMLAAVYGADGDIHACHGTFLDISRWDHATKSGPVRVHKVVRMIDKAVPPFLLDPDNPPAGELVHKIKSHKATLGRYQHVGGYIPLRKGAGGKRLKDLAAGSIPRFSEGIEDGLNFAAGGGSLASHLDDWIGAAVSLANMGNVFVPAQAGGVCLLADSDPSDNESAADAFASVVGKQQARRNDPGFVLAQWPARGFKDFSDQACGVG